jgi:hypothetical protein
MNWWDREMDKSDEEQEAFAFAERFYKKVEKRGVDECWLWLGAINAHGYGNFNIHGKTVLAHRVSYFLSTEDPADGDLICHSCDVPACVNPRHLWRGTPKDNMVDMVSKGRVKTVSMPGEQNPRAKITADMAREIAAAPETEKNSALGRKYGLDGASVGLIRNGTNWSHATGLPRRIRAKPARA